MTEAMDKCDSISDDIKNVIDAKYAKIFKLNNDIDFLRTKQHGRMANMLAIKELEISLTGELKSLCDAKITLSSDIETMSKVVKEKHKEVENIESAMEISKNEQSEQMTLYEKTLRERLTRFHDALRIYNEEYLSNEIEKIRDESRNIEDKIGNLDKRIEALVSKYKLNEIGNIKTSEKELLKLTEIWSDSNWSRISARKLYENLNKELEVKVDLNDRKIARII